MLRAAHSQRLPTGDGLMAGGLVGWCSPTQSGPPALSGCWSSFRAVGRMLIKARACAYEYVPQKRKENILHDLLSHVFALRLVRRLLLPFELRQLLMMHSSSYGSATSGSCAPMNGEPAILRFAISEEEHERALTLVSATSRRAPPVESDEDEDEDEEAGGAPAAATALGPPPRRLTLRHGRKVPAVKYF